MTPRPSTTSPRAALGAALVAALVAVLVASGAPAAGPDPLAAAARPRWAKRGLERWPGRVVGRRLLVRFRRGVERATARAALSAWGGELGGRVPLVGADVVRVPAGFPVARALARLEASPLVAHVEPDHLVLPAAPPTDPRFDHQWGLRNTGQPHPVAGAGGSLARGRPGADIRAVPAWDARAGRGRPVIAVVDSGVDVDHPDLDGNLWANPRETPGNGVDDDRNGYVDDVHGWDFARGSARLLERDRYAGWDHGTHVAGIAAAEHSNGVGVAGVCPVCRVMVLKFMRPVDTNGDNSPDTMAGTLSAELRALDYAAEMGARVVNASYGSSVWSPLERRAFARLGRRGVLSVAAAGNENGDNDMYLFLDFDDNGIPDSISPAYPATYDLDGIVSVAASNHGDRYGYSTSCARNRGSPRWPCTFTNWGRESVDVAAPGVDIVSTVPTSGADYATFNGTSMAAPHVSGLAGLVLSGRPRLSALEVKRIIMASAERPAGFDRLFAIPGLNPRRGGFTRTNGRIDALGALRTAPPPRRRRSDGDVRGARRIARTAAGSVRWPRDVNDVFKKRLRKGRAYRVVLDGSRGDDFDLVVYKPGVKEIWQIERGCFVGRGKCKLVAYRRSPSGDEVARFRARKRGTYFFQVSSFFSSGRYTLGVRRARP